MNNIFETIVAPTLLERVDAYAELSHVNGSHLYNANTSAARKELAAALHDAPFPEITDAMVLAVVQELSPSIFKHGLTPLPRDGIHIRARMATEEALARRMLAAALGASIKPPREKLEDADLVFSALTSGEWHVEKYTPCEYFTAEANAAKAWAVRRRAPPFGNGNHAGHQVWEGPTARAALTKACAELGVAFPKELPQV